MFESEWNLIQSFHFFTSPAKSNSHPIHQINEIEWWKVAIIIELSRFLWIQVLWAWYSLWELIKTVIRKQFTIFWSWHWNVCSRLLALYGFQNLFGFLAFQRTKKPEYTDLATTLLAYLSLCTSRQPKLFKCSGESYRTTRSVFSCLVRRWNEEILACAFFCTAQCPFVRGVVGWYTMCPCTLPCTLYPCT